MRSTTKVWIALIAISLIMVFAGAHFGNRLGLMIGFLCGVGFVFLILFSSSHSVMEKLQARRIVGQDPWNLSERVAFWSHLVAIPLPRIYIIDSPVAVAFSMANLWGQSAVCISEGLFKKLSTQEIDAVIAHRICHIVHIDTFGFGVASAVSGALMALADLLDRVVKTPLFHALLNPFAWLLIRLKVSEANYFRTDDLAVSLLRDRRVLAQALWKLDSLNQAWPLNVPKCSSHLFMVHPCGINLSNWYYVTHPKAHTRIQRIVGYEPL